jgi:hypothetical protein
LPVIAPEIFSHKFQPGLETKVMILLEADLFLAAVQNSGDVKLIFTLSKKNKSPFCSNCSIQKCRHFKQYTEYKNDQRNANNLNESSTSNESAETNSEDANPQSIHTPLEHYDDIEPLDEYTKNYGYNLSRIVYPYKMDPVTQGAWLRRLDGHFDLPERIIPEFIEGFSCTKHGNTYDPNDDNLLQFSTNIIIYTETSEKVYHIKTYARRSLGGCKCKQQADTHKLLLWHLGKGKMIDYMFLSCYMHNMRANGTPTQTRHARGKFRRNIMHYWACLQIGPM